MTYLELVNKVLVRLREDTVANVSENTYSALIGALMQDVIEEVQDAWDWQALRTTIQVPTVASTISYSLETAGKKHRVLNVWNDTEEEWVTEKPSAWLTQRLNLTPVVPDIPLYWGFNGYDANEDPIVDLYPVPDGVYNINFNMVVPQYAEDMTDGTVIKIPTLPIIYGTWARAISERGEDGGQLFAETDAKYMQYLADAISIDARSAPGELCMKVD